jgi:hypothetical protein
MGRISRAAASVAAGMALPAGLGGAALAMAPAGATGAVRVCNPTAVEYATLIPCARPDVTAVEYAL